MSVTSLRSSGDPAPSLLVWFALRSWPRRCAFAVCALPSRRSSRLSEPCVWKSHRMGPGLLQAGGPWRIPDPPPPSTPPAPLSLKSEPSHAYRAELLTQKPVWGEGGPFGFLSEEGLFSKHPASPLKAGLVWRLHIQNPWKTLNRSLSGATERPL